MDRLIQTTNFFNKRTYDLTDTGLKAEHTKLFSSVEYFVDYEDVGIRLLKEKGGISRWLIAAIICFILSFLIFVGRDEFDDPSELFFLLGGILFALIFVLTYKKTFYLVQQGNKNAIEFSYDKPTKEELEEFIESLKSRRQQVLDGKYGEINAMLPYEQNHQNLMWLLNHDVIDKNVFDVRLKELNSKFNRPGETPIGFNLR